MKIYKPTGKAREYSPLALNYFKGCDHGCKYCYVPRMMKRFNKNYNHSQVTCDLNLDELEKSILKLSPEDRQKQVLLSFTSDPYNQSENGETRKVLRVLSKHQMHVAILTKDPSEAIKDINYFYDFEYFKIGTTLTFIDYQKSLEWEPIAPIPRYRIEGLKYFVASGLKTFVSFEPVIEPKETLQLISEVSDFVDHIKIGKLNYNKEIEDKIDWADFLEKAVKIIRGKKIRAYIKKDLAVYGSHLYGSHLLKPEEMNPNFLNI